MDPNYHKYSVSIDSSGHLAAAAIDGVSLGASGTTYALTTGYVGVSPGDGSLTQNTMWIRVRIYPPSGTMPVETSGAYQSLNAQAVTFSPSNSVAYGAVPITVTAACTPGSDTCDVDSPLGTHLATGTGSATYTISSPKAVGTYTYYANDITNSQHGAATTLTITAVPLILAWSSQCTNPCINYGSAPNPCTTSATVSSYNNQVTANLLLNNQVTGSGTSTVSFNLPTDLIGAYSFVFNALATANYTANSLSYSTSTYVPLYVTNSMAGARTTLAITPATSPYTWNTYYPIKLDISSPDSTLAYGLTQDIGGTPNTLQTGVANIVYIPPANQVSGNYVYQVTESQTGSSNTVILTVAANALSMNSIAAMTPNSPQIQYFQNIDCLAFNSKPLSYSIQSDNPLNQHNANQTGGTCGAVWSNANLTFMPKVTLNYGWTSFVANIVNNPAIGTITQDAMGFVANALSPNSLYSREIVNITHWSQLNFSNIAANTSGSFTYLLNNYTETALFNTGSVSATKLWMPQSAYASPPIILSNISAVSTAPNHFSEINNFCPSTVAPGTYVNWQPHLVPTSYGELYTFQVYQGSGYGAAGYYLIVQEQSPTGIPQVQSYKITSNPFADPLVVGSQYRFVVYTNGCGSQAYASPLSTWTSPVTLTIPLNIIVPSFPFLTANAICSTYMNSTTNSLWVACSGQNPSNFVYKWNIIAQNSTSILGYNSILKVINITGASFAWVYPLNGITTVIINAYWGNSNTVMQNVLTYIPKVNQSVVPLIAGGGLLAIFILLGFVFFGKGEPRLTLIMLLVGLFLCSATLLIAMPAPVFYGVAGTIIIIVVLMESDR